MKILFLSTDFRPYTGGVAELSFQVCAGLAQRGHEVQVLAIGVGGEQSEQVGEGFSILRLSDPLPPRHRWWLWRRRMTAAIENALVAHQPDVLLLGTYHALLWPALLRRRTIPYCMIVYGEDISALLGSPLSWRRTAARKLYSEAGAIFCISNHAQRMVYRLLGSNTHSAPVIGCGVVPTDPTSLPDRTLARARLGWGCEPVVITVARLVHRKGIDTVLRAMKLLAERYPSSRYVVVGNGPCRRELEGLAASLGISSQVQFWGHVDDATKTLLYCASDVFAMASRHGPRGEIEGFGIVFLEANDHGLAVVGSDAGGIPDAIEAGVNGLLVQPDDPVSMARAIGALLEDSATREEMVTGGRRRIRERLNWGSIAAHMETELVAVVGSGARDHRVHKHVAR